MHLTINSVFKKVHEVDEILNQARLDVFSINESKLDSFIPESWYKNIFYRCLRMDRNDKGGGGLLIFIRKEYVVKKLELTDFETISFQLSSNGQLVSFLSSYKSPSTKDSEYLAKLEDFILTLDPAEPIFIIGDLNMDLRSDEGIELKNFLINNDLKNFVNTHTRIERRFYKKRQKWIVSKTLIDVVIHNQNKIIETAVIGCPFSDHCFVISSLSSLSQKKILPGKMANFLKKEDNGIFTILNLKKRVLIRTTFYTLTLDESFNP